MQPPVSKIDRPFRTWSGLGFIAQLALYGIVSGIELALWITNTRDFIIFGHYIGLWGSLVAYAIPWIMHLVQMTGATSTMWDTT